MPGVTPLLGVLLRFSVDEVEKFRASDKVNEAPGSIAGGFAFLIHALYARNVADLAGITIIYVRNATYYAVISCIIFVVRFTSC